MYLQNGVAVSYGSSIFSFLQKLHTYMEPQKTQNCQSNPVKKEQSWRYNLPRLQTILQSYSNEKSMGLVQKQQAN